MITVKVIYKSSGKPAESRKVALYISRFMASGVSDNQYTDSNGETDFDIDSSEGIVYIDGSIRFEGHLSGRILIYI